MVSARELGWSRATDWWLLDGNEAHGPFLTYDAAVAASLRPKGTFGYGPAPDLTALFPRGIRARANPTS